MIQKCRNFPKINLATLSFLLKIGFFVDFLLVLDTKKNHVATLKRVDNKNNNTALPSKSSFSCHLLLNAK